MGGKEQSGILVNKGFFSVSLVSLSLTEAPLQPVKESDLPVLVSYLFVERLFGTIAKRERLCQHKAPAAVGFKFAFFFECHAKYLTQPT